MREMPPTMGGYYQMPKMPGYAPSPTPGMPPQQVWTTINKKILFTRSFTFSFFMVVSVLYTFRLWSLCKGTTKINKVCNMHYECTQDFLHFRKNIYDTEWKQFDLAILRSLYFSCFKIPLPPLCQMYGAPGQFGPIMGPPPGVPGGPVPYPNMPPTTGPGGPMPPQQQMPPPMPGPNHPVPNQPPPPGQPMPGVQPPMGQPGPQPTEFQQMPPTRWAVRAKPFFEVVVLLIFWQRPKSEQRV